MGIAKVRTDPQNPSQNPFVERMIGSIRRECLKFSGIPAWDGINARDRSPNLDSGQIKGLRGDVAGYVAQVISKTRPPPAD